MGQSRQEVIMSPSATLIVFGPDITHSPDQPAATACVRSSYGESPDRDERESRRIGQRATTAGYESQSTPNLDE